MYESFYGLKEKPFSLLPDPAYLYLSRQHGMAMSLLEYGLENHTGFCVVTGKAGTGKTTLLRQLLNRAGDDVTVGLITNTHHAFGELLRWILHAFSLPDNGKNQPERHQIFTDYLIRQYAKNKRTLLIIDEAQNLSPDALEELRMLSNINSGKDMLLQVILAGQPPLREILRRPELKQFAQRIAVDYHLDTLDREQTQCYIRHRIVIAGGEMELFTVDACEAVFEYSGGIPRLINTLCDFSLVYAYADHAAVVTGELVEQIIHEREAHGALPIFGRAAKSSERQGPAATSAQPSWAAKKADNTITQPNAVALGSGAATEVGGTRASITVNPAAEDASPRSGKLPLSPRDGATPGEISNAVEGEKTRPKPATSRRSRGKRGNQADRSAHHATTPQSGSSSPSLGASRKARVAKLARTRAPKGSAKARAGLAARQEGVHRSPWMRRYVSIAAVVGLLSSAAFVWHVLSPQSGQEMMTALEGWVVPVTVATPTDESGSHAVALGNPSSARDSNAESAITDETRHNDKNE
jgi:general secretion pathway protein A